MTPAASHSPASPVGAKRSSVTPEANPEVAERHEKLTEDVDDLLDEIDSVLEENAEEFGRGYVQKEVNRGNSDFRTTGQDLRSARERWPVEFHRDRRRLDGLGSYCKACAAVRSGASRLSAARQTAKEVCPRPSVRSPVVPRTASRLKPSGGFPRPDTKTGGRHSYCKPCHNARGKESKQRLYGGTREYHLRRRYGIGQAEFDELLAEQGGVCAICGAADPQHVDHDHRTGWVRGILCFNCNGGLGQFRDSPTSPGRSRI